MNRDQRQFTTAITPLAPEGDPSERLPVIRKFITLETERACSISPCVIDALARMNLEVKPPEELSGFVDVNQIRGAK